MLDYLQLLLLSPSLSPLKAVSLDDDNDDYVRSLRLAIFFHDVVYDPQSNQNEKDSAKLFDVFCKEINNNTTTNDDDDDDDNRDSSSSNISTTIHEQVVTLILATEGHQVLLPDDDDEITIPSSSSLLVLLQGLFLDLDMAVLGKDQDAYLAYAGLIRREYSFVPRHVYCEKRAEILQGFLENRPRIYLSPPFHRALEEAARRNLQEEIKWLQTGVIPGDEYDETEATACN
jgi:predicted metal-dependent HD superfamily phosphohydrolase